MRRVMQCDTGSSCDNGVCECGCADSEEEEVVQYEEDQGAMVVRFVNSISVGPAFVFN